MKIFDFFTTFISLFSTSTAPYSPKIRNNAVMCDEMIKSYFNVAAPEIALFLVNVHGFGISLRQLKRILRRICYKAAK